MYLCSCMCVATPTSLGTPLLMDESLMKQAARLWVIKLKLDINQMLMRSEPRSPLSFAAGCKSIHTALSWYIMGCISRQLTCRVVELQSPDCCRYH